MAGNPTLKGQPPSGGPTALKLDGPIIGGQCWISVGVGNPLAPPPLILRGVQALIDTGATASSISDVLAKQLGITGRGLRQIQGAGGSHTCTSAPVAIGFRLPNGQPAIRIIDAAILPMSVPLLFGMSEIMPGYLVVDGVNGVWRWTLPLSSVRSGPTPPNPAAQPASGP